MLYSINFLKIKKILNFKLNIIFLQNIITKADNLLNKTFNLFKEYLINNFEIILLKNTVQNTRESLVTSQIPRCQPTHRHYTCTPHRFEPTACNR